MWFTPLVLVALFARARARAGREPVRRVMLRLRESALVVLLAAAWLALTLRSWTRGRTSSVNDLPLYRAYADAVPRRRRCPYRDIGFEYPPLAAPLIAVPGLVSLGPPRRYRWAFAAADVRPRRRRCCSRPAGWRALGGGRECVALLAVARRAAAHRAR